LLVSCFANILTQKIGAFCYSETSVEFMKLHGVKSQKIELVFNFYLRRLSVSSIRNMISWKVIVHISTRVLVLLYTLTVSRDSSVGIATGYELDHRGVGVRVPVGSRLFTTSSTPALGSTQPPI
jgi:hypothetical protein